MARRVHFLPADDVPLDDQRHQGDGCGGACNAVNMLAGTVPEVRWIVDARTPGSSMPGVRGHKAAASSRLE